MEFDWKFAGFLASSFRFAMQPAEGVGRESRDLDWLGQVCYVSLG